MIKLILQVRRKPGMDRGEFRRYYEGVHAPLAASLMEGCKRYVRNFVEEEPDGELGFDAITEFWFDGEGRWADVRSHFAKSDSALILAEDEARFMDRSSMRIVIVSEAETAPARLLGNG
jgi:uncharacterized protein (TIGR02118 family)